MTSKENEVAWHAPLIHSDFYEAYTYDGLNRLTSTDRYNGTSADQSFTLDANDNITGLITGGTLVNRTSNDFNQLTQVGTTSLTYDASGNMTTDDQSHTLIYDAWNRLVTVKNGGSTLATYIFDGIGRRVKATVSGTTTDSYFSGSQELEEDVGGQATERNVFSPAYVNAILLREKDTDANGSLDQRVYFTSDANYNVTGVVSSSGTVLQRQIYDAYGDVSWKDASWNAQGSDSYGLKSLFQGMRYDSAIGWYVTPNRLYRAPLAYWNRVDPAMADGLNWFVPFADNPINSEDPTGLWKIDRERQSRAFATPEPGDTVRKLANQIGLSANEYTKWLKVTDGLGELPKGWMPQVDEDVSKKSCILYSVPNTAYVDLSDSGEILLNYQISGHGEPFIEAWRAEKLKVVVTGPTSAVTAAGVQSHLLDPDLYRYFFGGHGAGGSLFVGWTAITSASVEVRPYGIAEMILYACETNDDAPSWQKAVAKSGLLTTYKGEVYLFSNETPITDSGTR